MKYHDRLSFRNRIKTQILKLIVLMKMIKLHGVHRAVMTDVRVDRVKSLSIAMVKYRVHLNLEELLIVNPEN